jgi:hypothetical protein
VITAIVAYTRITIIAIFAPSPTCNELKSFIIDDFKMKKSGPDHIKLSKERMDNIRMVLFLGWNTVKRAIYYNSLIKIQIAEVTNFQWYSVQFIAHSGAIVYIMWFMFCLWLIINIF